MSLERLQELLARADRLVPSEFGELDQLLSEQLERDPQITAGFVNQVANQNSAYQRHIMSAAAPQSLRNLRWGDVSAFRQLPSGRVVEPRRISPPAATTAVPVGADIRPQIQFQFGPERVPTTVYFNGNHALTTRFKVSAQTANVLERVVANVRDAGLNLRPANDTGPANPVQVALELLADLRDQVQIATSAKAVVPRGRVGMTQVEYDAARQDLLLAVESLARNNAIEVYLCQHTPERKDNNRLLRAYNWTRYELERAGQIETRTLPPSQVAEYGQQHAVGSTQPGGIFLVASGQAVGDTLGQLFWYWQTYPQLREGILARSRYVRDYTRRLFDTRNEAGHRQAQVIVDIEKWLRLRETDLEAYKRQQTQLDREEVSLLANYISSLTGQDLLASWGFTARSYRAGGGVSQGETPPVRIAGAMGEEEGLRYMVDIAIDIQRARPEAVGSYSQLQVLDMSQAELRALVDRVNREMRLPAAQHLQISIVMGPFAHVVASPDLQAIRRLTGEIDKTVASLKGPPRFISQDLPSYQVFTSTTGPFHHTVNQSAAYQAYLKRIAGQHSGLATSVDPSSAAFPVFSTLDGRNLLHPEADPAAQIPQDMTQNPMDYSRVVRAGYKALGGEGFAVSIGPAGDSSAAFHMNANGGGIRPLDLTREADRAALANRLELPNLPEATQPFRIVETPSGRRELHTPFVEWSGGMPPIMISGMTPVTLPWMVAAVSGAGYLIELRTGDLRAVDLRGEVEEVSRLQEGYYGHRASFGLNLMLIHNDKEGVLAEAIKLRRESHRIDFIAFVAGVPDYALVEQARNAGMKVIIKIGSADQYYQARDLVQKHPALRHQIALTVECKKGGGHFGPETIAQTWAKIGPDARKYFVTVRAGGISTRQDIDEAFTVGAKTGNLVPVPFDAVVVGSEAMLYAESPLIPAAQEALTRMREADVYDSFSPFGAPVHYYLNGFARLLRDLGLVAVRTRIQTRNEQTGATQVSYRPFTEAERNQVTYLLNHSGTPEDPNPKPWFSNVVHHESLWDRLGQSIPLWDLYVELVSRAQTDHWDPRVGTFTYEFGDRTDLRDFVNGVDRQMQDMLLARGVDLSFANGGTLYDAIPRPLWWPTHASPVSFEQAMAWFETIQHHRRILDPRNTAELRAQAVMGGQFSDVVFAGIRDALSRELRETENHLAELFPTGVTRETLTAIGAVLNTLRGQGFDAGQQQAFAARFYSALPLDLQVRALTGPLVNRREDEMRAILLRWVEEAVPELSARQAATTRIRSQLSDEARAVMEALVALPEFDSAQDNPAFNDFSAFASRVDDSVLRVALLEYALVAPLHADLREQVLFFLQDLMPWEEEQEAIAGVFALFPPSRKGETTSAQQEALRAALEGAQPLNLADTLRVDPGIYYQYETRYGEWTEMSRQAIVDRFYELHTRVDAATGERVWIEPIFERYHQALIQLFSGYGTEDMARTPSTSDIAYIDQHLFHIQDRVFFRFVRTLNPQFVVPAFRTGFANFANVPGASPEWMAMTPGVAVGRGSKRIMPARESLDGLYNGIMDSLVGAGVPRGNVSQLGASSAVDAEPLAALQGFDGLAVETTRQENSNIRYSVSTAEGVTLDPELLRPTIVRSGIGALRLALESAEVYREGATNPEGNRLPGLLVGDPETRWDFEVDPDGTLRAVRKFDLTQVADTGDAESLRNGLEVELTLSEDGQSVDAQVYGRTRRDIPIGQAVVLRENYRVQGVHGHDRLVLANNGLAARHRQALAPVFFPSSTPAGSAAQIGDTFTHETTVSGDWIADVVEATDDHNIHYVFGSRNGFIDHLECRGRPRVVPPSALFGLGIESAIQAIYPDSLDVNPLLLVHRQDAMDYRSEAREGDVLRFEDRIVGYEADPQNLNMTLLRVRREVYRVATAQEFLRYAYQEQSPHGTYVRHDDDTITFQNSAGEEHVYNLAHYLSERRQALVAQTVRGNGELIAEGTNTYAIRAPLPQGAPSFSESRFEVVLDEALRNELMALPSESGVAGSGLSWLPNGTRLGLTVRSEERAGEGDSRSVRYAFRFSLGEETLLDSHLDYTLRSGARLADQDLVAQIDRARQSAEPPLVALETSYLAFEETWDAPDQDRIDAFARTGDQNLIHVDRNVARFAGLPGTINHGELIRRIVERQLVNNLAAQDPRRIRHHTMDWVGMVPTGSGAYRTRTTVTGLRDGATVVEYEVLDSSGNLMATGTADIAPEPTARVEAGQGTQEAGMHRELVAASPRIAQFFSEVDQYVIDEFGWSPREILENKDMREIRVHGVTYRHPQWVGQLTQFTQPILFIIGLMREMRDRELGIVSQGTRNETIAGHSLGEYIGDGIAGIFDDWRRLVRITAMRGMRMAQVVDPLRDPTTGQSPFSMYGVMSIPQPVLEGFIRNARAQTVEAARTRGLQNPERGLPVDIVNFNTPVQFVIAGYDEAVQLVLQQAEAYARGRASRLGQTYDRAPYSRIGVDVPFHLWDVLGPQVEQFRRDLNAEREHVNIAVLRSYVGRHYPNLIGIRFEDTRAFVAECARRFPQSEAFTRLLASFQTDNPSERLASDDLLIDLYFELRALQFANSVQWTATVENMHRDGIRRFLENGHVTSGGGSVISGMVSSTLKRIAGDGYDAEDHPDRVVVYNTANPNHLDLLTHRAQAVAAASAAASSPPMASSPAAAPQVVVQQVQMQGAGPVNDAPVPEFKLGDATNAIEMPIRLITASVAAKSGAVNILTTMKTGDQIGRARGGTSQDAIRLGKRLGTEFGVAATDPRFADAQDRGFGDLAGFVTTTLSGKYSGSGPFVKELFAELKWPVDVDLETLRTYLATEWRMPPSQVTAHLAFIIAAAQGWSALPPAIGLADYGAALHYVDQAVAACFAAQGIARPDKASEIKAKQAAAGGGGIDLEEAMPQILEAKRYDDAKIAFTAATGQDLDDVLAKAEAWERGETNPESPELLRLRGRDAELTLVEQQLGNSSVRIITNPLYREGFARRHWTNWAASQTLALLTALRFNRIHDERAMREQMGHIANRADDATMQILDYWLANNRDEQLQGILEEFKRLCEWRRAEGPRYRPNHPITMPVTMWRTDQHGRTGEVQVLEVPRVYPAGHPRAGEPVEDMAAFIDLLAYRSRAQNPLRWEDLPQEVRQFHDGQWKLASDSRRISTSQGDYRRQVVEGLNRASSDYAAHPDVAPVEYLGIARQAAEDGLSFSGRSYLLTGATLGNINFSLARNLVEGGAHVVLAVRDVRRHDPVWTEYQRLWASAEGRVTLVQYGAGNQADAEDVLGYVYNTLKLDLDGIVPFAAQIDLHTVDQHGTSAELGDTQATQMVNVDAIEQLIGATFRQKERAHSDKVARLVLPLSDNDGGYIDEVTGDLHGGVAGGDGRYPSSKADMRVLMARAAVEGWGKRIEVRALRVPNTRGTGGVNAFQDPIQARMERDTGSLTFTSDEVASMTAVILADVSTPLFRHPDGSVRSRAVSVSGGLNRMGGRSIGAVFQAYQKDFRDEQAGYKVEHKLAVERAERAAATEKAQAEAARKLQPGIVLADVPVHSASHTFTRPALADLTPAEFERLQKAVRPEERIYLNPNRIAVKVAMDHIGPHADLENDWHAQTSGLTPIHYTELARQAGIVEKQGSLWKDLKRSTPDEAVLLTEPQVMEAYKAWIDAHTGSRYPEPEMTRGFDPQGTLFPVEVRWKESQVFVVGADEIAKHRQTDGKTPLPDRKITPLADGRFRVTMLPGSMGLRYEQVPIDTIHIGQLLTGWNAANFGYGDNIFAIAPDPSAMWLFSAAQLAFARMGVDDPSRFVHDTGADLWGTFIGSGIGPQGPLAELFGVHGVDDQTLANSLLGAIIARFNMHLTGAYGALEPQVAACATFANSVAAAWKSIMSGESLYAMAGAVDNGGNRWAAKSFRANDATRLGETGRNAGRSPDEMANSMSDEGAGFPLGEGAVFQIYTTLAEALKRGLPIYDALIYTASATNIGDSLPAPYPGAARPAMEAIRREQVDWRIGPNAPKMRKPHGTGTKGDGGEVRAITAELRHSGRTPGNPVWLSPDKNRSTHWLGPILGAHNNTSSMALSTGRQPSARNVPNLHPLLQGNPYLSILSEDLVWDPNSPEGIIVVDEQANGFGQQGGVVKKAQPAYLLARLWDPVHDRPLISVKQFAEYQEAMQDNLDRADQLRDELFAGQFKFGDKWTIHTPAEVEARRDRELRDGGILLGHRPDAFVEDKSTLPPSSPQTRTAVDHLNIALHRSQMLSHAIAWSAETGARMPAGLLDELRNIALTANAPRARDRARITAADGTVYVFSQAAGGLPSGTDPAKLREYLRKASPLFAYRSDDRGETITFYANGMPSFRVSIAESAEHYVLEPVIQSLHLEERPRVPVESPDPAHVAYSPAPMAQVTAAIAAHNSGVPFTPVSGVPEASARQTPLDGSSRRKTLLDPVDPFALPMSSLEDGAEELLGYAEPSEESLVSGAYALAPKAKAAPERVEAPVPPQAPPSSRFAVVRGEARSPETMMAALSRAPRSGNTLESARVRWGVATVVREPQWSDWEAELRTYFGADPEWLIDRVHLLLDESSQGELLDALETLRREEFDGELSGEVERLRAWKARYAHTWQARLGLDPAPQGSALEGNIAVGATVPGRVGLSPTSVPRPVLH